MLKTIVFGVFCSLVLCNVYGTPCTKDDQDCIKDLSSTYIKALAIGMPEHDIPPLDPLHIEALDHEIMKDVIDHFFNIQVTGMKNTELTYYHWNYNESTVEMKLKLQLNVNANCTTELKNIKNKTLESTYKADIASETKVGYAFELTPDDKGAKYFTILKETIECETITPTVTIDDELLQAFHTDPDIKHIVEEYESDSERYNKEQTCHIVKAVVAKLVDHFRLSSKIQPANFYITDI